MVVRRIGSGGAKLAENQVAVDAELDDANIRGEAEHGQEGNDGPVGRSRSVVLLPIHFLDRSRDLVQKAIDQADICYASTF